MRGDSTLLYLKMITKHFEVTSRPRSSLKMLVLKLTPYNNISFKNIKMYGVRASSFPHMRITCINFLI